MRTTKVTLELAPLAAALCRAVAAYEGESFERWAASVLIAEAETTANAEGADVLRDVLRRQVKP